MSPNGCKIKPQKNRSVVVYTNPHNVEERSIIMQFSRADVPVEELEKATTLTKMIKGKVRVTIVPISEKSALALYVCLQEQPAARRFPTESFCTAIPHFLPENSAMPTNGEILKCDNNTH